MTDTRSGAAKLRDADYGQHRSWTLKRQTAKWKNAGLMSSIRGFFVRYQISVTIILFSLLGSIHILFPTARQHTRKFYKLSYFNPESGGYRAGSDDMLIVASCIAILMGIRVVTMNYTLIPLAKWGGIRTGRDQTRFAEQGWLLICTSVSWTIGMYIMVHSDYWLDLKELWTNWPNREIGRLQKWYILAQHAFWMQQILVINIEKPRKDYWQMLVHHIVTTMLIFTSYGYHQTKVANLILCIMDVVDLFFPTAKCLKYLGYSKLCDAVFGLFVLTWLIARHALYLAVCHSVWVDIPVAIDFGCYKGENAAMTGPFAPPDRFLHLFGPFRDSEGIVCFTQNIKRGFLGGLLFLQGIQIMWFVMIINVAIKVVKGGMAEDTRSEDESDKAGSDIDREAEELRQHFGEQMLLVKEQVAGAISPKGRKSSLSKPHRTTISSSTGVSFPGKGGRKELLGRIGCDKDA